MTSAAKNCSSWSLKTAIQFDKLSSINSELEADLKICQIESGRRQKEFDETSIRHQSLIETLQSDFDRLAQHTQCQNSADSRCLFLAQKYSCVFTYLLANVCSTSFTPGQELFNIPVCNTLSDATFPYLNFGDFLKNNPITSILIILLFTLSCVGLLTILVSIVFVCLKCHLPRKIGVATDLDESPSLQFQAAAEVSLPLHVSVVRAMERDLAEQPRCLSVVNENVEDPIGATV